jgi:N-acyl-D-amino-acid deacylase
VLQPAGANRTQQGKSRLRDALADEVRYYVPGAGLNGPIVQSVFPGEGAVPLNYGGYYFEVGDASGAWVSSTVDLLRFLTRVDGRPSPPDILGPQVVAEMTGSGPDQCAGGACYYAFGWWVRPNQGDATWWHGGDLPSTKSILVRSANDFAWAALFNTAAPNDFVSELDAALWKTLASVTSFPAHDLFSTFR